MRADDRSGGAQGIRVDMAELRQLYRGVAGADKAIAREMRKAMVGAAGPMVRDVQMAIRLIPSSGRAGTGVREALARGTKATATSTTRTTGIRITTSGRFLPPEKQPLVRAMNSDEWRHPVFGKRLNSEGHVTGWRVRNYRTKFVQRAAMEGGMAPASVRSWGWVAQKSRPYFGRVIYNHLPAVRAGVVEAIEKAAHRVAEKKGQA